MRHFLAASLLAWLAGAAGCSAPDPFEGTEFERARRTQPLPYAVKIGRIQLIDVAAASAEGETTGAVEVDGSAVEVDGSAGAGAESVVVSGEKPFSLALQENEPIIRDKIKESLEKFAVFAKVASDDAELEALGLGADLELNVYINSRGTTDAFRHQTTGIKWVNLVLWLFAGIPGCIIEDTYVDPGVNEIVCTVSRPSVAAEGGMEDFRASLDLTDVNKLNFVRRASWLEYFAIIIIPPFLVGSDREAADEALYDNYVARMQSGFSRQIKEDLPRDMVDKRTPQLIVTEVAGTVVDGKRRIEVLIFSDEAPDLVVAEEVRRGADGALARSVIYQGEPERLGEQDWPEKAKAALGAAADYLGSYVYKFGVSTEDGLVLPDPSEDSYVRFTVDFPTGRRITKQTWTIANGLEDRSLP